MTPKEKAMEEWRECEGSLLINTKPTKEAQEEYFNGNIGCYIDIALEEQKKQFLQWLKDNGSNWAYVEYSKKEEKQ